MSDAELVHALGRGDEIAFAEVCRRHRPSMERAASRVCGPTDADDVTQEILTRLWLSPGSFEPTRGSLRTYLLTRTQGRAIDIWRKDAARRSREATTETATAAGTSSSHNVESQALDRLARQEVTDRLALLRRAEQQAIFLAYFGGYSYRQVADLLDRPEGTVKSSIRLGLRRLRPVMEDLQPEQA